MNHKAIRRVYANAVAIDDDAGVFDGNGNTIIIDQALVDTAAAQLQVEAEWQDLRQQRNQILAETDWTANSDVVMTDEMKTYRQALRDLPANTADPVNPTWPEL
jgi:hypothetical protein